jgi:hypothetical protein
MFVFSHHFLHKILVDDLSFHPIGRKVDNAPDVATHVVSIDLRSNISCVLLATWTTYTLVVPRTSRSSQKA